LKIPRPAQCRRPVTVARKGQRSQRHGRPAECWYAMRNLRCTLPPSPYPHCTHRNGCSEDSALQGHCSSQIVDLHHDEYDDTSLCATHSALTDCTSYNTQVVWSHSTMTAQSNAVSFCDAHCILTSGISGQSRMSAHAASLVTIRSADAGCECEMGVNVNVNVNVMHM
jgi:hypothetical protein